MAKIDVLDILRAKKQTPLEFDFDNLWIPPINAFLSMDDVESLRRIATSLRLSSKIETKYKMIDDIMRNRGFKRFSAGTNRVVYSFLEDDRFVVKIAVDKVGMQDNPLEYKNQEFLKPYCTKMFYISPCGTVGFAERVLPIKNKNEFREIAPDVFDIIVNKILGKYVMGDIGTKYFMNWGIRRFQNPVILDFPYCYKLDGKKLFCNKMNPITNEPCNGEIDYDQGFNHLVCTRCGKTYLATDLRDDTVDNKIIIKGGIQMRILLKKGDQIVGRPIPTDEVMVPPTKRPEYKSKGLVVKISGGKPEDEVRITETFNKSTEKISVKTETSKTEESIAVKTDEDVSEEIVLSEDVAIPEISTESSEAEDICINDSDTVEDENPYKDEIIPSKKDVLDTFMDSVSNESSNVDSEEIINSQDDDSKNAYRLAIEAEFEGNEGYLENQSDDGSIVEEDDKYAHMYDDEDHQSFSPIRKKRRNVERDSSGRFVSSKNKSSKTIIPNK